MLNIKKYISKEEKFLYGFLLSILIGDTLSSVLRYFREDYFNVGINVVTMVSVLFVAYRYEKYKNYTVAVLSLFWITSISTFIYIIYLEYSIHIFLIILIPLAGAILLNTKDFIRHGTLFLLIFTAIMTYGFIHKERYPYLNDSNFVIGFIVLFFFLIVFSFVYHKTIKNAYIKLQKSDHEKELLLKEIHHRVKNNLNMMTSILGLQEDTAKTEDIRLFIIQNRLRINSIALVHELLYKESNFKSVHIDEYIQNLIRHITALTKNTKLTLKMNIEELEFNTDDIIHIGIIINELMTNSLKYAFADNTGHIDISLTRIDNHYLLDYKDDGRSFDIKKLDNDGFGLNLVKLSAEHLNGMIDIYEDDGLHTKITFKGTGS